MKALIVAPVFDEATRHSYDWSRLAKTMLEEEGYLVHDLSGRGVGRREVEEAVGDTDIVCFFDHGDEDRLFGDRSEPVLDLGNVDLLSGREVYTMACLSARRLGVEAWRRGAKAYWGYEDSFIFTTDAVEEFREFAVSGLRYRLQGKSWSEALELARKLGRSLADKLADEGKIIASSCMHHDADALRCYDGGEPPARCLLRRIALKIFGRVGWLVSRLRGVCILGFGVGYGIALHDYAHALWQVGGYREILSFQGGYLGFALMLIFFILEFIDFLRMARR